MSVMRSLASAARGALWLVRAGGLRDQLQRLLLQEQRRRWRAADDLRAYERRVYSQNGEDGILQEILGRVGVLNRFFVEVGVESGRECNCARLVLEENWRGVFVEAEARHFGALAERYSLQEGVSCVRAV